MALDFEEMSYNFGCGSCGVRRISADDPARGIPVRRVVEKLDACFARNDLAEAGRLLDYWRQEALHQKDLAGELSVVNEQLGYTRRVGDRDAGLAAVERAGALVEALGVEDTVSGATVLLNAATTLKAFGQAERALPLYDRAGAVLERELDGADPLLAGCCNNRALALADLGGYEQAEQLFLRALDILSAGGGGQAEAAVTWVNLAHLYEDWLEDPFEKVEQCMERAEALLNDPAVPRDGNYAFVCSKCAPSFEQFGYFAAARELAARAEVLYAGT